MKIIRDILTAVALVLLAVPPAKAQTFSFDPSGWHTYYNDFDRYAAADWTINRTEAGSGSGTTALTNVDGGGLLITNDNADNDNSFFQLPVESFKWETGKRLYFETRFKVSNATETDIAIGLQITDTTPLDVTDGIFFLKADDAATVSFLVEKNNTATTAAAIATLANDTWITLAFYYEPSDGKIQYLVNGVVVGSSVVTNVPDDEELAVSFALQNGSGSVTHNMTIDYVLAMKER